VWFNKHAAFVIRHVCNPQSIARSWNINSVAYLFENVSRTL
jgi:hypothetical protein